MLQIPQPERGSEKSELKTTESAAFVELSSFQFSLQAAFFSAGQEWSSAVSADGVVATAGVDADSTGRDTGAAAPDQEKWSVK
jgi:hypothetical protein